MQFLGKLPAQVAGIATYEKSMCLCTTMHICRLLEDSNDSVIQVGPGLRLPRMKANLSRAFKSTLAPSHNCLKYDIELSRFSEFGLSNRFKSRSLGYFTIVRTYADRGKKKNYYSSLGITPSATQEDIKSAYYKLSKVYHPDRNLTNVEAATKFREVNEAYQVLGNFRLRRKYDKGMLITEGGIIREGPDIDFPSKRASNSDGATHDEFYRSRSLRSNRPPPASGRSPIYNYDEWTQHHYGHTFARSEAAKKNIYEQRQRKTLIKNEKVVERFFGIVMFLVMILIISQFAVPNYDNVPAVTDSKNGNDSSTAPPSPVIIKPDK